MDRSSVKIYPRVFQCNIIGSNERVLSVRQSGQSIYYINHLKHFHQNIKIQIKQHKMHYVSKLVNIEFTLFACTALSLRVYLLKKYFKYFSHFV